jgi:MFS family permease
MPEPGAGRLLYWATLVNAAGTGMYVASSAIFFVNYVGMPAGQVGLGLSIGGLIGLLSGFPVGHLADRRSPRAVYAISLAAEAAAMTALVFVRSFWAFVAVATLMALTAMSSSVARGKVVRGSATGRPARLRAYLRSIGNIGLTFGGGVAGVVIAVGSRPLYPLLILANAVSFGLCALLVLRLPRAPVTVTDPAKGRWAVLRDLPFLGVTAVNLVMTLQYPILTLILPLWILTRTDLPRWLIAAAILVNTIMVALLQVRLARGVDSTASAAKSMVRAGFAFLAGFALMAALGWWSIWLAAPLLIGAVVVFTFGEIYYSTASNELSFNLAPAAVQGQYLGVYFTAAGLARVVSPALATFLCLGLGFPGWVLFGLLMLTAGLLTPIIVRRVAPVPSPAPAI